MNRRPRTVIPVNFRSDRARRQGLHRLPVRQHRQSTWKQAFLELRGAFLVIAGATAGVIYTTPGFLEYPAFLQGEAQTIDMSFGRCGSGFSRACVVDGDTIRIGDRRIRIVGIDTAERDARCEAEAVLAELATRALQDWLNRGPFVMTSRIDEPRDRYGRELQTLKRVDAAGNTESLAAHMKEYGGARSYSGGYRDNWC